MYPPLPARACGEASTSSRCSGVAGGSLKQALRQFAASRRIGAATYSAYQLSGSIHSKRKAACVCPEKYGRSSRLIIKASAASAAAGQPGDFSQFLGAAAEAAKEAVANSPSQSEPAQLKRQEDQEDRQKSQSRKAAALQQPGKDSQSSWYQLPQVPWGTGKIVQVMVLWLLAYIIIGQVAMPICLSMMGMSADDLSARGHALMHLCLDVAQLGVSLLILWSCLRQFKPLQRGLFPIKWRGTWWLVVALACCVFPLVDWVAVQSMGWFPLELGEVIASQIEASLSMGDWVTNIAYFSIVSICAPVWEEAIFRGFLLSSLARYMAPHMAVAASSLLFAMCHFRLQTFLPLLMLGVVFSCVFIKTRNLLPPIVLHSLWNVFVLTNLLLRPTG